MDWFVAAGSTSLGILIGALVGWFFNEAKAVTPKVLAASVSSLVGSSVLTMFSFLAGRGTPTHEYWLYPVGLLIGFAIVTTFEILNERAETSASSARKFKSPT